MNYPTTPTKWLLLSLAPILAWFQAPGLVAWRAAMSDCFEPPSAFAVSALGCVLRTPLPVYGATLNLLAWIGVLTILLFLLRRILGLLVVLVVCWIVWDIIEWPTISPPERLPSSHLNFAAPPVAGVAEEQMRQAVASERSSTSLDSVTSSRTAA